MAARRFGLPALGLLLLLACGVPEAAPPPVATPSPAEVGAVFARALAYRPLAVGPGQVAHSVERFYERHFPEVGVDRACRASEALYPERQVRESWAVADERGRLARQVTYTRDGEGRLVQVGVFDHAGTVSWVVARGVTRLPRAPWEPKPVGEYDGRGGVLSQLPDLADRPAQGLREETVGGRPAVTVEYRWPADDEWRERMRESEAPYLKDLAVLADGRRLSFDRETGAPLRDLDFAIVNGGKEYVTRSLEWVAFEVLDPAGVPDGILAPAIPDTSAGPPPLGPPGCSPATPGTPQSGPPPPTMSGTPAPAPTPTTPVQWGATPRSTPDEAFGAGGLVTDFLVAVLTGYPKKARTYLAHDYAAEVGDLYQALGIAKDMGVGWTMGERQVVAGGVIFAPVLRVGGRESRVAIRVERRGEDWRIVAITPLR
jgi:hypothetical protein